VRSSVSSRPGLFRGLCLDDLTTVLDCCRNGSVEGRTPSFTAHAGSSQGRRITPA
jgi:hypothetical protein